MDRAEGRDLGLVLDHRNAGLDEVDVAVMDLAEKVEPELRDVLTVGRPIAES